MLRELQSPLYGSTNKRCSVTTGRRRSQLPFLHGPGLRPLPAPRCWAAFKSNKLLFLPPFVALPSASRDARRCAPLPGFVPSPPCMERKKEEKHPPHFAFPGRFPLLFTAGAH